MRLGRSFLAGAGALAVFLFSPGVFAQQVLFDIWITYDAAKKPVCVFSVDIDDDHDQDLIISHSQIDITGKNPLIIMKNDGAGFFTRDATLYTRGEPVQVVARDMDLDGDMDILTANASTDRVSIFKNRGGALGYEPPLDCPVGGRPLSVLADLIDSNATPDIVTTNAADGQASLLLNHGAATFPAESTKNLGIHPRSIVAFDMDNDGDKDLAASLWALKVTVPRGQEINRKDGINGVVVLENLGNGRFDDSARVFYKIPQVLDTAKTDTLYNPCKLVTADFNGDGYPDLAMADSAFITDPTRAAVSIFLNNGNKTFARPVHYRVGLGCRSIFADDLDRDGFIDIAAANTIDGTVSFLKNNGNGTFASRKDYLTPVAPYWVDGADYDRDGDIDLAVVSFTGASMAVLRNQGDGKYEVGTEFSAGQGTSSLPLPLATGDLDNDGDADLAAGNASTNRITIHRNNGSASFPIRPSVTDSSLLFTNTPRGVAIADFDGDGWRDIAVANQSISKVSIFRNRGNGKFASTASSEYPLDPVLGNYPYSIVARDLDGDTDIDLATANYGANRAAVLLNDGSGTFVIGGYYPTGSLPYFIASADFNGDGYNDLTTLDQGTGGSIGTISLFLNDGNGAFPTRTPYAAGISPSSLVAADLNANGDIDWAVSNVGPSGLDTTLLVFMNNGSGSFAPGVRYTTGTGPVSVAAGDVNGDGIMDLVTTNYGVNALSFFAGAGGGAFAPAVEYGAGLSPSGLAVVNLDGDGDLDLAIANRRMVASPDSGGLTILKNFSIPTCYLRGDLNGDNLFTAVDVTLEANCIFRGIGTCPVCVTDLNCDGRVSPADVIFLIQKVFNGVPLPSC